MVGIVVELLVTKLVRLSFFAENKELFEPAYAIEIETIGAFMTMITSVIPTPSIRSSFIIHIMIDVFNMYIHTYNTPRPLLLNRLVLLLTNEMK